MSTLITQDEFEENLLPNPRVTMALPYLAPLVIPLQIPRKKLNQIGLWGRDVVPDPKPDFIQVGAHNRGFTKIEAHKRKITVKAKRNNQDTNKATKSKTKTGKAKHYAFHNGQNDCKESVKLAKTLHIQEVTNLMKNKYRHHHH
jgi:hypothetical protein